MSGARGSVWKVNVNTAENKTILMMVLHNTQEWVGIMRLIIYNLQSKGSHDLSAFMCVGNGRILKDFVAPL